MEPKYVVEIVCLANSKKMSGRCVAGKVVSGPEKGKWVRPVSGRPNAEISEDDRRFKDGTYPKLGDVVRIPMKKPVPLDVQPENQLIDDRFYWSKKAALSYKDLRALLDEVKGPLWENRSSSTYGQYDRVVAARAAAAAKAFGGSLALVEVDDLIISVSVEGAQFNNAKRKVRGTFTVTGVSYTLGVTDVAIENAYLAKKDGAYKVGTAILCISLAEVAYGDHNYKLLAAAHLP